MPLIKPPESMITSPRTGLITGGSDVAGVSPEYLPYVNVGGVLKGARGMDISGAGSRIIKPLVTPKTEKEVMAYKEGKVREYKGGLMARGYEEFVPNILSKRIKGKYELININPVSGDVQSMMAREKEYKLIQLQNTLSNIKWRNTPIPTKRALSNTAKGLGYDIDPRYGKIVPKGYYLTNRGQLRQKTTGYFGTPETMELVKASLHPGTYEYTMGRLQEKTLAEGKTLKFDPIKGWIKESLIIPESRTVDNIINRKLPQLDLRNKLWGWR